MNYWWLRRKVHASWLLSVICGGILVGVFVAQYLEDIPLAYLYLSFLLIIFGFWCKKVYIIPLLFIGGLLFGLWRGSISQIELKQFEPLYGNTILVNGVVSEDIDIGTSNQMTIRLNNLSMNNAKLSGTLWVTASSDEIIKRGDGLQINGKLTKGFGNFAGVIYRAKITKIIHPEPGDIARIVRDKFTEGIRRAISEPEANLGVGYLVGQRRALPIDLISALQIAGVTHIVVASGYNLTILVRLARRLFNKISKYLSAFVASVMIFCFIAVTGVSPSMSRAGIVAGLSLLAWYYGRKIHPIVLLLLSIAITVIINPSYAWGDLGWQLSFMAFAGVMIFAPLFQRYLFGDKKPGFIGQILGETVSAQLVTAPIIIMAFGQFSNVAIIANLLILPLVPLAMLLTFISGVGGLLFSNLASIIGLPATWLMEYMIKIIDFLANLPWATNNIKISWWMILIYYFVIVILCGYMWRVTKYNLREVNLIE